MLLELCSSRCASIIECSANTLAVLTVWQFRFLRVLLEVVLRRAELHLCRSLDQVFVVIAIHSAS